jgi:hypothetical protein
LSVNLGMTTFLDQNYPKPFSRDILQNADPFLSRMLEMELFKARPELFDWRWMQGIEIKIGQGERKEYWDESFWWLSRRYRVGTGRIQRDVYTSHAVNYVDLGKGWRLLCGGFQPAGKERSQKHLWLADFLYQSNKAEPTFDGTQRLVRMIKYLAEMPENPFNFLLLQIVGSEVLGEMAPHYEEMGYRQSGHTSEELKKIYRRLLKTRPTEVFGDADKWEYERYWISDLYEPKDPILDPKECPYLGYLQ